MNVTVAQRELHLILFQKWWYLLDEYKPSKSEGYYQIGNSTWFFKIPSFRFRISFELKSK